MSQPHSVAFAQPDSVAVIAIGYVGLPLTGAFVEAGLIVVGFDTAPENILRVLAGQTYIRHFPDQLLSELNKRACVGLSSESAVLGTVDVIPPCVPTPLTGHLTPDLRTVQETARTIAPHLRRGMLVALDSTTYPETTGRDVRPILERLGAVCSCQDPHIPALTAGRTHARWAGQTSVDDGYDYVVLCMDHDAYLGVVFTTFRCPFVDTRTTVSSPPARYHRV